MGRLASSLVAFGAALGAPLTALACPVCATREGGGPMEIAAIGALIVAPWFAAAGIGWWIRRGLLEEAALNSSQERGLKSALDVEHSG